RVAAWVIRGTAYLRLRRYPEALADLTRAIAVAPRHVKAYHLRAQAHAKCHDLAAALADLTQAVVIDPRNAASYAHRAAVYRHQRQHAQALADLTQAVKLDGRYAAAYCGQSGLVHAAQGQFERALADYAVALLLEPDNAELAAQWDEVRRAAEANR